MRYLIISLFALVLGACSIPLKLNTPEGRMAGTGTLKFGRNSDRLNITLNGKTYVGDVISKKTDNLEELREQFGSSSKAYKSIINHLNTRYNIYYYSSRLTALDGTRLECDFLSRYVGGKPLGECIDGSGQYYPVNK